MTYPTQTKSRWWLQLLLCEFRYVMLQHHLTVMFAHAFFSLVPLKLVHVKRHAYKFGRSRKWSASLESHMKMWIERSQKIYYQMNRLNSRSCKCSRILRQQNVPIIWKTGTVTMGVRNPKSETNRKLLLSYSFYHSMGSQWHCICKNIEVRLSFYSSICDLMVNKMHLS